MKRFKHAAWQTEPLTEEALRKLAADGEPAGPDDDPWARGFNAGAAAQREAALAAAYAAMEAKR